MRLGSRFGAGAWRQAGLNASKQRHQVLAGKGPDTSEHASTADLKANALPHCQADKPWMQTMSLQSTPPLAHDMGQSSVAPSAQPPAAVGPSMSAALCQSRAPTASASLASRASTSFSSSQQDNSTVLHTASTSSSSFHTQADSVISNACSSPHHAGASARGNQHRSCLQAPQMDAGAATSKGRAKHLASEQQDSATSQTALTAYEVCGSARLSPAYT